MHGEYQDFLVLPNGDRRLIGEGKNLVVASASIVCAMVMKQDAALKGFMHWAIGDGGAGGAGGSAAWDAGVLAGTIVPATSDIKLLNEIYRKAVSPSDITFIDAVGSASASPTNRLQVVTTFLETEPTSATYYIREFGLVGGNSTGTANSGFLINHKLHETYVKTAVSRLERRLRFSF